MSGLRLSPIGTLLEFLFSHRTYGYRWRGRFFLIYLCFVFGLGWGALGSIFSSPFLPGSLEESGLSEKEKSTQNVYISKPLVSESPANWNSPDAVQERRFSSASDRRPSSSEEMEERGDLEVLRWDWPCSFRGDSENFPRPPIYVHSSRLRLFGVPCSKGRGEDGFLNAFRIINQTNGFTATLLATEGYEYTTDFIALNRGENQIVLSFELHSESETGSGIPSTLGSDFEEGLRGKDKYFLRVIFVPSGV